MSYGAYVDEGNELRKGDFGVLEDISGRITIKTGGIFNIHEFVSGTIFALKGQA